MQPHICSETGTLKRAVIHSPGREISHVSPVNQRQFLFSDLLYERLARREHDTLVSLLQDVFGVELLRFRELLTEAITRANSMDRLRLLETVFGIEGLGPRDQERLLRLISSTGDEGAALLAERLIVGETVAAEDSSVSAFLNQELYYLPPVPNLMLVRDLAALVRDEMILAWNSEPVRRRENLLWRFILQHSDALSGLRWHSWMADEGDLPDRPLYSLEGGNVIQAGPDVLVVGQSLRTGAAAVERLSGWLAERVERETHLFLVTLPEPLQHLDTVFTMLSRDECLVFPPSIFGNGPESVNVLEVTLRPGEEPQCASRPELIGPLSEALGTQLHPVPCGGDSPLEQRREQWWGGCSMLAVSPGKVISFRSAQHTVAELGARGYECLEADRVLVGEQDPHEHEKCVVLIRGSELSRARGGPRGLVLPLVRGCP